MNINNRHVDVMYFKHSGKYYTRGTYLTNTKFICDDKVADMNAIIDEFKTLCAKGSTPGLANGGSEFYKVINNVEGYPVLLMPEKNPEF